MLTAAQTSISCTSFFFLLFPFHSFDFLAISKPCVPFFVQLKQPNIFPPLAVLVRHVRTWAQTSDAEDSPPPFFFYLYKLQLLIVVLIFLYYSSSICFPLPSPTKKPNNHFFDKVSAVLFSFYHHFFSFLLLLGLKAVFDLFILSFFRVGERLAARVRRRARFCQAAQERVGCSRSVISRKRYVFPLGHVTPHCWSHWWIFMGVISSFTQALAVIGSFLLAEALLNFDL